MRASKRDKFERLVNKTKTAEELESAIKHDRKWGTMDKLREGVQEAIKGGAEFLFSGQRKDFHWCAELESNVMVTAEYVMFCQMVGWEISGSTKEKLVRYFFSQQRANGSWSIAVGKSEGDVSFSAEAYLALRILGVDSSHENLKKAQTFILGRGGLINLRLLTQVCFASFGLVDWDTVPVLPPEIILTPPQLPINIYSFSSWARATLVPSAIIFHHRPVYALPNGKSKKNCWLDHLKHPESVGSSDAHAHSVIKVFRSTGVLNWKSWLNLVDPLLRIYERYRIGFVRKYALRKCTEWILERVEESGDIAGIIPPMLQGAQALLLQGYSLDSDPVKGIVDAIERFSWEDSVGGLRIQSCVSPVWDTALSVISLLDCKHDPNDEKMSRAVQWIIDRQIVDEHGDWKVYRPELAPGGWSFEYSNTWYPDVDDTAAVLLAILKHNPWLAYGQPVQRAVEWTLGMQNRDGGWAAFDVNNDKIFLNEAAFSDMEALCDPSTPDVAGRVLEALGLLLQVLKTHKDAKFGFPPSLREKMELACQRGIEYMRHSQEVEGSWFGRWGVNYIYGTSNTLCGLARVGVGRSDDMVARAIEWMKGCQNVGGGWGEGLDSYSDKSKMGKGVSTASQTAWALMGLLAYLPVTDLSIRRGVGWLLEKQIKAEPTQSAAAGQPNPVATGLTWDEPEFTGTGFPNHFYIRYHYYRHYFPMMALGRFLQTCSTRH